MENLIKSLENKLAALEAKKKVAIEKGSLELFFGFDAEYWDTFFQLHSLKHALKQGFDCFEKARGAPPRTKKEIEEVEKEIFEIHSREWLLREKGKGAMTDFDYGIFQGKLEALKWVLESVEEIGQKVRVGHG